MTDLRISVIPSMQLVVALVTVHLAAAALLWLVPLPVPAQALVSLAIAASLGYLLAREALRRVPHSIVALEVHDGAASLQTRDGKWVDGEVLGSSYVSPSLTVVNFRPRGRWRACHLILVPDNADPHEFRRLRTWLRWKRGEAAPPVSSEQE